MSVKDLLKILEYYKRKCVKDYLNNDITLDQFQRMYYFYDNIKNLLEKIVRDAQEEGIVSYDEIRI